MGFDGSFFTHFLDLKVYVDKEGKPVYAVKGTYLFRNERFPDA